jgi:oligopeptide transport system substrate-binding protein
MEIPATQTRIPNFRFLCGLLAVCICGFPGFAGVNRAEAGSLRRGLGPEPDSLHIHQAQGLAAINLLRDLREGLLTFDSAGTLAGRASGRQVRREALCLHLAAQRGPMAIRLAPVISSVPGGWRFRNPRPAGLLRELPNRAVMGHLPAEELGVSVIDGGRLQVVLAKPAPWILEILAHPVSFPLHAADVDSINEAKVADAGVPGAGQGFGPFNGPFELAGWTPRSHIRLRRNAAFHAVAEVMAEEVEYYPIEEPATELARYRAGELDITETIPAGRFAWLQENLAAELHVSPYLGSFWLGLNMHHAELAARLAPGIGSGHRSRHPGAGSAGCWRVARLGHCTAGNNGLYATTHAPGGSRQGRARS